MYIQNYFFIYWRRGIVNEALFCFYICPGGKRVFCLRLCVLTHKDILSIDRVQSEPSFIIAAGETDMGESQGLSALLQKKRADIITRWAGILVDSYPSGAHEFLSNKKNRFANPVGYTIAKEIAAMVDGLINRQDIDSFSSSLDKIMRIRTVQDFKPSEALAFVYQLKGVIRECLDESLSDAEVRAGLEELDAFTDALGLLAFDIYVGCKEQLYQLRVDEVKRNTYMLVKRAKMLVEGPEGDQGSRNLV